ncbi:DNA-binding protein HU-beta [Maribacter dokdonensis]|uniref:DNA-binding protein HU-beta n=2 Tax=Maribacter dokdonensis TaxID=320912 RepID=A0A1H4V184_9FLAO|nr:DNA-binding protein HU-beta [Maribacter dokdonensis]
MNRTVLSHYISEEAGLTKKQADRVLESIMANITTTLKKGNKVTLNGFGSWSVVRKDARTGMNPSTGQSISVSAKNVVRFAPSDILNRNMKDVL